MRLMLMLVISCISFFDIILVHKPKDTKTWQRCDAGGIAIFFVIIASLFQSLLSLLLIVCADLFLMAYIAYPRLRGLVHRPFLALAHTHLFGGIPTGRWIDFTVLDGTTCSGMIVGGGATGSWLQVRTDDGKLHDLMYSKEQPLFELLNFRYVDMPNNHTNA